jgi:hypothetical protein
VKTIWKDHASPLTAHRSPLAAPAWRRPNWDLGAVGSPKMSVAPLQFLLLVFAGWVNRRQLKIVEFLHEENRLCSGGRVKRRPVPFRSFRPVGNPVRSCPSRCRAVPFDIRARRRSSGVRRRRHIRVPEVFVGRADVPKVLLRDRRRWAAFTGFYVTADQLVACAPRCNAYVEPSRQTANKMQLILRASVTTATGFGRRSAI